MPAKDLGTKFVCFKCNAKFYDLKKPDPVCPKCGADQRESPANRPPETRKGRLAPARLVPEPEPVAEETAASEDEDEIEAIDDEEVAAPDAEEV